MTPDSRHIVLTVLLALTMAGVVNAMPPSPETYEFLEQNNRIWEIDELMEMWREEGINQPFDFKLDDMRRDDEDQVVLNVVCILADFDDQEADTSIYSVEHFQEMLFSEGEYRTGSMRDWYIENSYGEVDVIGDVFGWYRMEEDYAYYVDGQSGFGQYPQNAQGLVYDMLTMANDDIDFSDYDNDDDGVAEGLFVVHAGEGAEANNRDVDMIWSHAWGVMPNGLTLDGTRFERYAMEPENGRIGVFGHELAHSLFGLPDLYDGSYNSAGIGMWSMMAGGSWGGGGNTPVHFDAWSKARIGFSDPYPVIMDLDSIELLPAEEFDDILITWKDGEWEDEYFLIENRQHIGFDTSLPAAGLLIWHIDDTRGGNRNPWYPGNEENGNYWVALEQADGDFDMERDNNSGDSGDPFPGMTRNTYFGSETEPSSKAYNGDDTFVQVYNIEHYDTTNMLFSISLSELPAQEELSLFFCSKIPADHRYPDPDDQDLEWLRRETGLVRNLLWAVGADFEGEGDYIPEDLDDYNTIVYLESWRDDNYEDSGLSFDEQISLAGFLEGGGNLVLVGPDVATNLLKDENDQVLWQYLHAEYENEGMGPDTLNMSFVRNTSAHPYFGGMNFPFWYDGPCDDYVDVVGPDSTADMLFTDQSYNPRGVFATDPVGYRVILQPFLFGGLRDRGSTKERLMERYFEYFRYQLDPRSVTVDENAPDEFKLMAVYPNPFNGSIRVTYPQNQQLKAIDIYDLQGRVVARLGIEAGQSVTEWRPLGLATGSYFMLPSGVANVAPLKVTYIK